MWEPHPTLALCWEVQVHVSSILYLNLSSFHLPLLSVLGHCSSLLTCIGIPNLASVVFNMISTFVSSVNSYLIIILNMNKLKRLNAELFDILVVAIHPGMVF